MNYIFKKNIYVNAEYIRWLEPANTNKFPLKLRYPTKTFTNHNTFQHTYTPGTLTIMQRNVRAWKHNRHSLLNISNWTHTSFSSTHMASPTTTQSMSILNYNIQKKTSDNSEHNGVAIAIRKDLQYKLEDDFDTDLIAATFETR